MSASKDAISLNEAQRKVVSITDGPVLVVAGAGTGKTRVIVERIIRLITEGVEPSAILALTFTEKAAGEMLDRVSDASLSAGVNTTIATFNGFGHELLESYGGEYGLSALKLLGDTGQLVFLREHLDTFELDYYSPVSNPHGQLKMLADYVSLLKQQLILPAEYRHYADALPESDDAERLDKQKHTELANFYESYLKLCREEQVIDYDDQIYLTIEMLRARPNVLRVLQSRYKYLLVDEFQDTNPMQSVLIELLAGTQQNIMVVGDDDQSIYGWRGATLANILDFRTHYSNTQEITLTENYRSTQSILDSAYRLIQGNNPHRLEVVNKLDKHLHANVAGGSEPQIQHFVTYDAELSWVAEDIKQRLAAGEPASSIAVLARRNQGVQKMHEVLELRDIPHAVIGLGSDIYAQPAVRQLLEALKAIADPLDNMALFHCLSGPLFAIDIRELARISAGAQRAHQSLVDAIKESGSTELVEALERIEQWRANTNEQSVGTVAYNVITDSGWKQRLYHANADDIAVFTEIQAISKLFKTMKEFERIANVPSIQNYVGNLPALQAAGSGFDDPSLQISDTLVNVLSVHRAKGLEWNTVYIIDCTEGSFPLRSHGLTRKLPPELQANRSEADEHMAEERRLMYVASTRAKHELLLSYSDRHSSAGALRKPSRFISELIGHNLSLAVRDDNTGFSLETFSPNPNVMPVGPPETMLRNDRLFLSVSQIETWLRCPQDFYYRYVLAMPLPPAPQLAYGTLIHGVIERLHSNRQSGQTIPSLESITQEVLEGMPKTGYQSKRSRERAQAQAKRTITAIYERFSQDTLPIETELPFNIELSDMPLTIRGRIDAVYALGSSVEIRDFKTGTSVTTEKQAKNRATGSSQLTLYALAWNEIHGELPGLLSLDFVETGYIGSVKKQAKSLETLRGNLRIMTEQLQTNVFPFGTDHRNCQHPVE
jgi:DNA helicase-2/ATP-dependent DNA helicase PcrA